MSTEIDTDIVPIEDGKYTYVFSQGRVSILRFGKPWLEDPQAAKAWIAAASELATLRANKPAITEALALLDGITVSPARTDDLARATSLLRGLIEAGE